MYLKRSHSPISKPCSTSKKLQTVICNTIYQAWMIIEWKCPQIWMTNINMIMMIIMINVIIMIIMIIGHHLHHNNDHPHPTHMSFDWQLIIFLLFVANSLKLWNWPNCETNHKIRNWAISWTQILNLTISIIWLTSFIVAWHFLMLFIPPLLISWKLIRNLIILNFLENNFISYNVKFNFFDWTLIIFSCCSPPFLETNPI